MTAYEILNLAGGVALLSYNLMHIKEHQALPHWNLRCWAAEMRSHGHHGLIFSDPLWVIVGIIFITIFQYAPASFLNIEFGNLVQTGSNYYGLLLGAPFCLALGCWIMDIVPTRQIDIIVPAFPIALIFAKIGCFFGNCCGGVPWEYGFLNPDSQITEFPVQLLEAGVAFLIFLILQKIRSRLKPGTVFPVYLIIYSTLRFFTEFLRAEPNVWLCFKLYHFLCLAGIVTGIAEYFLVVTVGRRISKKRNQPTAEVTQFNND